MNRIGTVVITLVVITVKTILLVVKKRLKRSALLGIPILLLSFLLSVGCKDKPSDYVLARAIATFQLNKIRFHEPFKELEIGTSYPIYELRGNRVSSYDIKLVSKEGASKGYMIVQVKRGEFPIQEISTEGPSLTEMLRKKCGQNDFRTIWLSPTFSVALNAEGRMMAWAGELPDLGMFDKVRQDRIEESEFLRLMWHRRSDFARHNRKAIRAAWRSIPGGGNDTSDLVRDTQPAGNYSISYAEGHERDPQFEQIPANTGANTNDYQSGCGATAWATLIAWHDQLWTPDLLRGSEPWNGIEYGNPIEPAWNTYIDRIMIQLGSSEYLDTHDCFWVSGNTGTTHDSNMSKGFDYIREELGNAVAGESIGGNDLQKVYDAIDIDNRPVLIKTPDHFCVAAGFWYDNEDNNHFILINTGWEGPNKWIRSEYLEKYWYMRNIFPRLRVTSPAGWSNFAPTVCTTTGDSGLRDTLWVFWLNNSRIHYARGENGSLPDLAINDSLNVVSIYPPAVVAEEGSSRLYLAYVDDQHKIGLQYWQNEEKGWTPLTSPSVTTSVRPAIVGQQGKWFTIAFSDNAFGLQIIGTNRDLQRPRAWPQSTESAISWESDVFWRQVDAVSTEEELNFSTYRDFRILSWIRSPDYFANRGFVSFRMMESNGELIAYFDKRPIDPLVGAMSLTTSNDTIFAAHRSISNRIALEIINSHRGGGVGGMANSPLIQFSQEVAWLTDMTNNEISISSVDIENGKHPMVVIGWTSLSDGRLNVELLSMDRPGNCLNYTGEP